MSEENFDNANQAPEETGQAEISAEEKLGKVMAGEEEIEQEQITEEQPQKEQEKIVVGNKEFDNYEDAIEEYREKVDRYGDPAELRKKLSQRNDKAKQYEQIEHFFRNNREVAELMQKYQTDENLKTLVQAYENGYVKKDGLEKIKKTLRQQVGQNRPERQNNPQQVEQLINQKFDVYRAKMDAKNQFNNLKEKEQYSKYMNDNNLDFDTMANYVAQRQLVDNNGRIDMEKALNLYAVENNDINQLINQTAQNDIKKSQQQKKNAQVERPSARQPKTQDNPDIPEWAEEALNYDRNSGSGFN